MTIKLKSWLNCYSKNIENNDFNDLFFRCPNDIMEELLDALRIADINIPSYIHDYGKCVTYLNTIADYVELIQLQYSSDEIYFMFHVKKLKQLYVYDKQLLENRMYADCHCFVSNMTTLVSRESNITVTYQPSKTTNINMLVDYI